MRQPSVILTIHEVEEITGRKTNQKQREWFNVRGWIYETSASGRPIVGRIYASMKLGGTTPTIGAFRPPRQPNFEALG